MYLQQQLLGCKEARSCPLLAVCFSSGLPPLCSAPRDHGTGKADRQQYGRHDCSRDLDRVSGAVERKHVAEQQRTCDGSI